METFLFQMNRDNSGNSIDLILVGKCPLPVIRLYKRRNNMVSEPYEWFQHKIEVNSRYTPPNSPFNVIVCNV